MPTTFEWKSPLTSEGARRQITHSKHVWIHEKLRIAPTEALGFKIVSEIHRAERESYKLDIEIPGGTQIELSEE